jgi:hypothetical protein
MFSLCCADHVSQGAANPGERARNSWSWRLCPENIGTEGHGEVKKIRANAGTLTGVIELERSILSGSKWPAAVQKKRLLRLFM